MNKTLIEHDVETLRAALGRMGHKPSHARSILRDFYANCGSGDFAGLTCPQSLREALWQWANLTSQVIAHRRSVDGTSKLLVGYAAGGAAEAVLMPGHRQDIAAACVSSQIGCAMGCDFCASTRNGLERDLQSFEIVEQFIHLKRIAREQDRRLKTLVFMGMGEPMHNLTNVIAAIRRIADPDLGGLGWRQVTVSTVGIVPGIDRLAEADLNVHLALSLHAPDDQTREQLVPSNRRYPVSEIMEAARRFQQRSGRVVNIEYCMLAGVNDSDEQAKLLAELMRGFRAHVNLIPYNWTGAGLSGRVYERPGRERVERFLELLRERKVVAHVRETRGDDVSAACGQLRRKEIAAR